MSIKIINKHFFFSYKNKHFLSIQLGLKEYVETKVMQSRVPIVETSEAETVVKVKNHSMIMIGGLIKKEKSTSSMKVPLLQKLPVIGWLFGSTTNDFKKIELVIFLRPRIMRGDNNQTELTKAARTSGADFKRPQKDFLR